MCFTVNLSFEDIINSYDLQSRRYTYNMIKLIICSPFDECLFR